MISNFGGISEIGNYRQSNEDYYNFSFNNDGDFVAVVCDGMGGHSFGEVASKIAVDSLIELFLAESFIDWPDNRINHWLRTSIYKIQKKMKNLVKIDPSKRDMGTTLVAAFVIDKKVFVVNIGDSRLYKIHNDTLYQITTDQNLMNSVNDLEKQEFIFQGLYQRKYSEQIFWNVLTSALGPEKKLSIDIYVIEDIKGQYVLVTDGIHGFLSNDDFLDVFITNNLITDKIKILINRALDNLSTDNLTAVAFEIE